ncbi:MAG: TonB-dependent receptor [Bacteroidia bacterium]|nr:TonB-dependent receptor [Bacteroidia bacterium]
MKIVLFLSCLLAFQQTFYSQITQTIRGTVVDKESQMGIPGAAVKIVGDSTLKISANTDINGNFRLEKVPLGRYVIRISFIGYQDRLIQNVIVDAGKETILNIEMEESVTNLGEVEITGTQKEDANNEMGFVSVKVFDIEQTNRYAGSRGDPGRMASNFAGVGGSDDSRNDITIRGNSPMGLLWRIEGVDVPNPNHFAVAGTAGGAISILNNKVFGASDFYMGAFPAEYGNANAGVFDIKMRNGNNEKHEISAQFGLLGTELFLEGPISKKSGSTYLLAYRYSTFVFFDALNINLGTNATPKYQDLSFKLNFPGKKNNNFSLFGVGGYSDIDIILSDKNRDEVETYGDNNRDQYFTTGMGLIGMSYSKSLNEKTYFKGVLSYYKSYSGAIHTIFTRDSLTGVMDTMVDKLDYKYLSDKISLNVSYNKKFNASHSIKAGVIADHWVHDMYDSLFIEQAGYWIRRNDAKETGIMAQPYFQWKYKRTDHLSFTAGLHGTYYSLNGDFALEPRAGMKYSFAKVNTLTLGYGLHSQVIPAYITLSQITDSAGKYYLHNKELQFTNSHHAVLGYQRFIGKSATLKAECYYQHLFDVPIDTFPSSFSLVNQGSTFSRFFPGYLVNEGTADNIGFEITYEKGFADKWYMMVNASVYQALYKGSDGKERNSDFDGSWGTNFLIGKEFKFGKSKNTTLTTAIKSTYSGGKRFTPADTAASIFWGEIVEYDSLRNSQRFNDYFRFDFKLGLKINRSKLTHEIGVDLVNAFGVENELGLTYSGDPQNPIIKEYQLGFMPIFYYRIDFRGK